MKSVILMSGGLDSIVALGTCKNNYGVELALTFDYGQKALNNELLASKQICEYYGINYKVITLEWLKEITHTALVSSENIPNNDLGSDKSASLVWVPNRNALFLNIAACFADSYGYDYIIYGANKDEGETFSDNTEKFRSDISKLFETSTLKHPKVVAPLINYSKDDIVKIAIDNGVPLEYVYSCYSSGTKHCGVCESCRHLKRALLNNKCYDYVDILFGK